MSSVSTSCSRSRSHTAKYSSSAATPSPSTPPPSRSSRCSPGIRDARRRARSTSLHTQHQHHKGRQVHQSIGHRLGDAIGDGGDERLAGLLHQGGDAVRQAAGGITEKAGLLHQGRSALVSGTRRYFFLQQGPDPSGYRARQRRRGYARTDKGHHGGRNAPQRLQKATPGPNAQAQQEHAHDNQIYPNHFQFSSALRQIQAGRCQAHQHRRAVRPHQHSPGRIHILQHGALAQIAVVDYQALV